MSVLAYTAAIGPPPRNASVVSSGTGLSSSCGTPLSLATVARPGRSGENGKTEKRLQGMPERHPCRGRECWRRYTTCPDDRSRRM
jgi:hypothetical protein